MTSSSYLLTCFFIPFRRFQYVNNRERRERVYGTLPSLFLAAMMIGTGLLMVSLRVFSLGYGDDEIFIEDNIYGLIGRAILIVGGLAILYSVHKKKGNYYAIGVYALTLGLSRVIRSFPGLMVPNDGAFINDVRFYAALVFIVIGGNLALCGYNHLTVRTKDPGRMKYVAMLLLSVYSLYLGYCVYLGEDVVGIFLSNVNMFGDLPLYIGLLAVIFTKELVENAPMGRIASFLSTLSSNAYVGNSITISKEDAGRIEEGFQDTSSWKEIEIGDTVLRESSIVLNTHNGDKDIVLEKWPDSDCLYLTLINDIKDSFVSGQRMKVTRYEIDGDSMDLYDTEGLCVTMRIGGGC